MIFKIVISLTTNLLKTGTKCKIRPSLTTSKDGLKEQVMQNKKIGTLHATPLHPHMIDSNFLWQRGFHDNIICTTGQLSRIRKYISANAKNWHKEC
jgi:hypothetical protein